MEMVNIMICCSINKMSQDIIMEDFLKKSHIKIILDKLKTIYNKDFELVVSLSNQQTFDLNLNQKSVNYLPIENKINIIYYEDDIEQNDKEKLNKEFNFKDEQILQIEDVTILSFIIDIDNLK